MALSSLKDERLAERRPDGSWLLRGEPPANLRLLWERSVGEAIPRPGEYEGPD